MSYQKFRSDIPQNIRYLGHRGTVARFWIPTPPQKFPHRHTHLSRNAELRMSMYLDVPQTSRRVERKERRHSIEDLPFRKSLADD